MMQFSVNVNDMERMRYEAMVKGDIITLASMFSDELVYSHSDGSCDTKTSLLDKISTGYLDYLQIENHNSKSTVVGSTAIISSRMVAEIRVDGATRWLNNRILSVWTLQEGIFSFLAFQPTVLHKL